MSHSCPTCGQACYCGGDIDDCETVEENLLCGHCPDEEEQDMQEGCLYPGKCCMPGPHYTCECHTPENLMETETERRAYRLDLRLRKRERRKLRQSIDRYFMSYEKLIPERLAEAHQRGLELANDPEFQAQLKADREEEERLRQQQQHEQEEVQESHEGALGGSGM